jgi:hypothetical protein
MVAYLNKILLSQLEAGLCMMRQCVTACPPEHWEGRIANDTFRQISYHTLFFTDLYLSPSEAAFTLRELHSHGGDERRPLASPGLTQKETLEYVAICRQKAMESLGSETRESLEGPSGFSWYPVSRGELHLINIRHVQHHVGALSAFLRRVDDKLRDPKAMRWVGAGWRE